jgi:adenylate cyclase
MWLIVNPGLLDEKQHALPEGHSTIGRTEENTFRVLHMSLSRRHARLERTGERVVLVDLGSKNGTLVNGIRVDRYELREGDTFQCGDVLFKLVQSAGAIEPTFIQTLQTRFSPPSMEELLEQERGSGTFSALKVRHTRAGETRSAEKLQVLLKVSQLLSSAGPIDGLMERIAQLVIQILEVDRVVILLADPASGELRPRVARFLSSEVTSGAYYSQHVVEYVRTHSVAALFADAWQDPRLSGADSVMLQSIRSAMCVPLKPQDAVLGVLYVDNLARVNGFTEEDLEFLTAFGNQAAIALENSMLSQRLAEEASLRTNYLRFFPPTVIKKLQSAPAAPLDIVETEVTILFSDISGFTSLSSTLHPRQVVDLLNDYFPVMADIVFRYEGTLEKYIGDALMAVWGAPFSQPDDADRALRAAVEMQRALEGLNDRWQADGRPVFQIHVGLNTGRVAAGNIGSELYLQYATIGDATNVASRICEATGPGQICLSEATHQKLVERAWPMTKLPDVKVKGKQEPLTLYRVDWRDGPR